MEKQTKTPKPVKFIIVQDVFTKKEIEALALPPAGGTNFIFWYSSNPEEVDNWGLTIKQMIKGDPNKKTTSSTHVWKCTW
jgi:hypothetical protein